jgi:hypothetical protein
MANEESRGLGCRSESIRRKAEQNLLSQLEEAANLRRICR